MDLFVLASGPKVMFEVMTFPLLMMLSSFLFNIYYLKFKPLEERVAKLEERLSKQETTEND